MRGDGPLGHRPPVTVGPAVAVFRPRPAPPAGRPSSGPGRPPPRDGVALAAETVAGIILGRARPVTKGEIGVGPIGRLATMGLTRPADLPTGGPTALPGRERPQGPAVRGRRRGRGHAGRRVRDGGRRGRVEDLSGLAGDGLRPTPGLVRVALAQDVAVEKATRVVVEVPPPAETALDEVHTPPTPGVGLLRVGPVPHRPRGHMAVGANRGATGGPRVRAGDRLSFGRLHKGIHPEVHHSLRGGSATRRRRPPTCQDKLPDKAFFKTLSGKKERKKS